MWWIAFRNIIYLCSWLFRNPYISTHCFFISYRKPETLQSHSIGCWNLRWVLQQKTTLTSFTPLVFSWHDTNRKPHHLKGFTSATPATQWSKIKNSIGKLNQVISCNENGLHMSTISMIHFWKIFSGSKCQISQKVIFVCSNLPKKEPKIWMISALASKMGQIKN